ncbi:MAG: hypothetical protein JXR52_06150 [Bacteroidales bacterium]|nr:hypothetical protein [Bacteroidales bacterium]MBN2698389.1 hypothetical protein [Bacteroidales bacterium]
MINDFICPYCKGHLKVGDHIVFTVRNRYKHKGLLMLHPEIGNYTSVKHPDFDFCEGEQIDFYCPICSHPLESDFDSNLVYVILVDEGKKEQDIYFSRIVGERSTYLVKDDMVTATGEHASRYTYFKMDDRFKRYIKR